MHCLPPVPQWGSKAFRNMRIIPPGSGIVHQVNLEYLARVVFDQDGYYYPDSLVGTDSHTTMIDGLGVLGWVCVGGIEAEAVMLGQPISMVLPEVIGYRLEGTPDKFITSTDIVLTVTKHLRQVGIAGKFVEFFGPGVAQLSITDRATIANMCPEYGATAAFFPVDHISVQYLEQTGRDAEKLDHVTRYLKAVALFRDYSNSSQDPDFTQVHELDLSPVVPCCSGPKRPHDRVAVTDMKTEFEACLTAKQGFKGFQVAREHHHAEVPFQFNDKEYSLSHGSVVIAAITSCTNTSCTNTSNPSVMLGAGLLAKKAIKAGLSMKPYINIHQHLSLQQVPEQTGTAYPCALAMVCFPVQLDVFDAAERYQQADFLLMILAGKEYGSGSSRDWAAKGPFLLGIKAVLAESYERIHRSNLVGMGVICLEYLAGDTAVTLGLTGRERYTVVIPETLTPRVIVDIKLDTGKTSQARMRFDTDVELTYFHNGGILNYMIRKNV
ncbi:cytoplasmic aconitate hydratase-like [Salvelinus alpinus]|uniref:cytoplasmic aconitate hydratase-like n=1 Tax=Salvelinus alpinus TaxID=8036 RepID=UPI0039FCA955